MRFLTGVELFSLIFITGERLKDQGLTLMLVSLVGDSII